MQLPRPHDAVVCRPIDQGAILLQTEDEVYFGLNEVGLNIWQLLPPACGDLASLCTELAARYPDAPTEAIRADVLELLEELRRGGLVVDA
jgi:hypothetical protein